MKKDPRKARDTRTSTVATVIPTPTALATATPIHLVTVIAAGQAVDRGVAEGEAGSAEVPTAGTRT